MTRSDSNTNRIRFRNLDTPYRNTYKTCRTYLEEKREADFGVRGLLNASLETFPYKTTPLICTHLHTYDSFLLTVFSDLTSNFGPRETGTVSPSSNSTSSRYRSRNIQGRSIRPSSTTQC